jgi:signal transduction histidine kinase
MSLKPPISVHIGYLDLIRSNILNPTKAVNFIEKLQKTQHRLLSNINEFLHFIKLENHSKIDAHQNKSLNLYDFILDTLQSFEPFCLSKGIKLHFKTNISRSHNFSFDYSQLEKVINNLVDNAIKFSNFNQNIYFNFTVNTASLSISVKDEGIGIAQDQQDKIFSRFYQRSQGKSSEGFGIGLYLVKELVNIWSGKISLSSELNKGSTFTIDIPYSQEELGPLKSEQQDTVLFDDEKDKANQTAFNI